MTPEEEKANDDIRARVQMGRGCAWVVGAWLALMALACLGWFGGQVYQVWNG